MPISIFYNRKVVILVVSLASLALSSRRLPNNLQKEQKWSAKIEGDFTIGALLPIHTMPSNTSFKCGVIREHYGIQRTEMLLHNIDLINREIQNFSNYTIGIDIRDTCNDPSIALQQSIFLIRQSGSLPGPCSNKSSIDYSPMIGIIGPTTSTSMQQVQNLVQLFHISQVAYSSSSNDLADRSKYRYLARVIPSDAYQAYIMTEILIYYGWKYVATVNTDDNYGQSGIKMFKVLASERNICISHEDVIWDVMNDEDYEDILKAIKKFQRSKVIICFCDGSATKKLIAASKRINMTNEWVIIASEGWALRTSAVNEIEEASQGAIGITLHRWYSKDFDNYYLNLKPATNRRNPWFKHFWEYKFNCIFNTTKTNDSFKTCTGTEDLRINHTQDLKLYYLVNALKTISTSLKNMIKDVCGFKDPYCDQLYPFNGTQFMNYVNNVSIIDEEGHSLKSNDFGDPPARYEIHNYQKLENGQYGFVLIGKWEIFELIMFNNLQFPKGSKTWKSICSEECKPGYYQSKGIGGEESKCCWICVQCQPRQISRNKTCFDCPLGYWPHPNKSNCEQIIPTYVDYSDFQSLISLTLSCSGLIMTLLTGYIFLKNNDTPVVKSSTKELSYLMLGGMIIAHCVTFFVISKPTPMKCSILTVIPAFSFTLIYGSLLTKTIRIARILAISKRKFPKQHTRCMTTLSQIYLTCMIGCIELLLSLWVLFEYGNKPTIEYPDALQPTYAYMTCLSTHIARPFYFNFLLVILCTYYAFKTRNLPYNFNEAKFIGFAMYITCITWIAFALVYYGSQFKVVTACVSVSLNALVVLFLLFLPKVYVIIFRPEKNTRAFFITTNAIRCHIGAATSLNYGKGSSRSTTTSIIKNDTDLMSNTNSINAFQMKDVSCQANLENP